VIGIYFKNINISAVWICQFVIPIFTGSLKFSVAENSPYRKFQGFGSNWLGTHGKKSALVQSHKYSETRVSPWMFVSSRRWHKSSGRDGCWLYSLSGSVGAGAGSMLGTPPSLSAMQRSPATSATPSTPVVSLYAADSSTETTLSTVGCVYFADTFLLSGEYFPVIGINIALICLIH